MLCLNLIIEKQSVLFVAESWSVSNSWALGLQPVIIRLAHIAESIMISGPAVSVRWIAVNGTANPFYPVMGHLPRKRKSLKRKIFVN